MASSKSRAMSLSGFPEFLPEERLIELEILDLLRQTFELHGFSSLETRAVEKVEAITRKSDIDKEIYSISRLSEGQGDTGSGSSSKNLALHFDLTLPFARYVMENAGYLNFPLRRYQVQKVWRGERPQDGRFREFTQADIDIVGQSHLPFYYDIEVALVMVEVLQKLHFGDFIMRVNNRKLVEGFYQALGIENVLEVLQIIDKLEKIGAEAVGKLLEETQKLTSIQIEAVLALARIRSVDFYSEVTELAERYKLSDQLLEEGIEELEEVVRVVHKYAPDHIVADLSIARGLDYYTGTVYETTFIGHEDLGSICSGGRYDRLSSTGKTNYPGVGLSIGVTRLATRIISQNIAQASRKVPTTVLIALNDEDSWVQSLDVATALRARNISTEVSGEAKKFGQQIKYADKRGIPFVWFVDPQGGHSVRDLRTGVQEEADPQTWVPPEDDLRPSMRLDI